MSPSPSLTRRGARTRGYPASRNQRRYASASAARCGYRNRAPSTVPSTTVAPLAANTMSGSPGTGSMTRTSWPRSRYTCRSAAHCRIAAATSVGSSGRIHGLIAYVTAK